MLNVVLLNVVTSSKWRLDTQHNDIRTNNKQNATLSTTPFSIMAECCYAEYYYAECVMLSVIVLNVTYMPFMLSVIMLSVVMLSVVMLSVVAPFKAF